MADIDAICDALSERLIETLSRRQFAVQIDRQIVVVRALGWHPGGGAGSVLLLNSALMLKLPLPAGLRAKVLFHNHAQSVQQFVAGLNDRPWPAPGADPHVRVTSDLVRVWFGSREEQVAAITWRPFKRADLNL